MANVLALIGTLVGALVLAVVLLTLGHSVITVRRDRARRLAGFLPRLNLHEWNFARKAKAATGPEAYRLSGPQLTEVCHQFAGLMGWIDATPGAEWYGKMMESGGPEALYESMSSAIREAIERAAEQDNTSTEALRRFQRRWREQHNE